MKDIGKKMEDLTSEKKTTEEELGTTRGEIAEMKKTFGKMKSELQGREIAKLDEAKRLIVLNHQEGFKKAQGQVKVWLPSFDSAQLDVNCDIVDDEIVRESQLCSDLIQCFLG